MEGYEYSVYSSHGSDFSDAPEGAQEKTYEYSEYDGYYYDFPSVPVAGYQGEMAVLYGGKAPLVLGYRIANGDVEKLTAALDAKYTPAEAHKVDYMVLLQTAWQFASEEEVNSFSVHLNDLKHWIGPENTQIYLFQDEGDTIVMYFNASALENEDASTPVNADGL